jgi:hypothetical protein
MSEPADPAHELAAANAEAARVAAEKARLELAEWKSPAAAAGRLAQQRADTAKAEKSLTDASLGQFASAVPDLSKISTGSTNVDSGPQLFGSALALRALGQACRDAAGDIAAKASDTKGLLITTEADLASSDAIYALVAGGLNQLLEAAQELRRPVQQEAAHEAADATTTVHRESLIAAGIGVAAAALPAIVSLFSANRKISGSSVNVDDTQAAIGVAAALVQQQPQFKVFMDDFRTVDREGPVSVLLDNVNGERLTLARRKAELTGSTSPEDAVTLAVVNQVASAIDGFLTTILTVPDGATRSACTSAILREQLHNGSITRVLLVKGVGGSTSQVVNDKPLWFKDTFTTIASAGISWLLISTTDGSVVAGGAKVSTQQVTGTVGTTIDVKEPVTVSA